MTQMLIESHFGRLFMGTPPPPKRGGFNTNRRQVVNTKTAPASMIRAHFWGAPTVTGVRDVLLFCIVLCVPLITPCSCKMQKKCEKGPKNNIFCNSSKSTKSIVFTAFINNYVQKYPRKRDPRRRRYWVPFKIYSWVPFSPQSDAVGSLFLATLANKLQKVL